MQIIKNELHLFIMLKIFDCLVEWISCKVNIFKLGVCNGGLNVGTLIIENNNMNKLVTKTFLVWTQIYTSGLD